MAERCKLTELIDLHRAFSELSEIPRHLFDGYLLAKSITYSKVRGVFNKTSYSFDECDGKFSREYRIAPLMFLDEIHKYKIVPYLDTESTYATLVARRPDFQVYLDYWEFNSYFHFSTLHEQAHCIAEEVLEDLPFFERSMLSEALANTLEGLSLAEFSGQGLEEYILLNAFYRKFDTRAQLREFQSLAKAVSLKDLFENLFIRYFWLHQGDYAKSREHVLLSGQENTPLNKFLDSMPLVRAEFRSNTTEQFLLNAPNKKSILAIEQDQLKKFSSLFLEVLELGEVPDCKTRLSNISQIEQSP